jgi:hypothetical protein
MLRHYNAAGAFDIQPTFCSRKKGYMRIGGVLIRLITIEGAAHDFDREYP